MCGTARSHTGSNAAAHTLTWAGSSVTSQPSGEISPSPVKWVQSTTRSSNTQKSLPGSRRSEARRRGSHRTSSPALTLADVISCSHRMYSLTGSLTIRARRMTTPRLRAATTMSVHGRHHASQAAAS